MPTPKEERDASMCARYLAGETADALAIDFGLSIPSVRVILKAGNALRKGNEKRPKVLQTEEEKVISPLHAKIGAMLSHHRSFTIGSDRRKASEDIGWSMQRVAYVERGFYNLTLTDLQDLSRYLGKPIEDLVREKRKTEERQSQTEHVQGGGTHPGVVPFPGTRSKTDTEATGVGVEDTSQRRPSLQDQKEA